MAFFEIVLTETGRQLKHVCECGFIFAPNGCRKHIRKYPPEEVLAACQGWIAKEIELEDLTGPEYRYCQAVINRCHLWETGKLLWPNWNGNDDDDGDDDE